MLYSILYSMQYIYIYILDFSRRASRGVQFLEVVSTGCEIQSCAQMLNTRAPFHWTCKVGCTL